MEQYDCIVVGAGVIGLAIARRLAMNGLQTLILEKNQRFG
jgi:phytoene dehydrogenase-like protein